MSATTDPAVDARRPVLGLRFLTHSETGLVRPNNQDSGFANQHLLMVADGMGGAAAGDLASAAVVDTLMTIGEEPESDQMLDVLAEAIHRANERIADLIADDPSVEGMGTTLTAALFDGTRLGLAHIGDSRAYLLRDGRLERLTQDHTWVQALVDDGKITAEEAAVHPHRSLLIRVVNGQPTVHADLTIVEVHAGDRLLFCSDGVCGLVDDPEIAEAMQRRELDDTLARLVELAHAAGGIDNITVVLADVVDGAPTAGEFVLGAAAELSIPDPGPPTAAVDQVLDDDATDDTVIGGRGAGVADTGGPTSVPDGESGQGSDVLARPSTGPDPALHDEDRYAPQRPAQHRRRRVLVGLLAMVLVLGAALGTGYAWTRTQFYVGAAGDQVAIFQGLPDGLPLLPLSAVYELQDLPVSSLPPFYQAKVRSAIEVESLSAARETVSALRATAQRCDTPPAESAPRSPAASAVPSPKPSASSPVISPAKTPTPQPTASPAPAQGC
jgi:protein phosphatase